MMDFKKCIGCYLRNDEGNCKLARHPDRACHDIRVAYQIGRLDKEEECWIPCSERLPEDVAIGEEYPTVIFCTDKATYTGFYEHYLDGKWWTEGDYTVDGVIAWMPLPKPYKERGKNG